MLHLPVKFNAPEVVTNPFPFVIISSWLSIKNMPNKRSLDQAAVAETLTPTVGGHPLTIHLLIN